MHMGLVSARSIRSYDEPRQIVMRTCMKEITDTINKHLSHDENGEYKADAPLCVQETFTVLLTLLSDFQAHVAEQDELEAQREADKHRNN